MPQLILSYHFRDQGNIYLALLYDFDPLFLQVFERRRKTFFLLKSSNVNVSPGEEVQEVTHVLLLLLAGPVRVVDRERVQELPRGLAQLVLIHRAALE